MTGVFIPGVPAPQGSKRHVGNGRMVESSKAVGPWRERVALFTQQIAQPTLSAEPFEVTLSFVMPRPASAPKRRTPAAVKRPDLDKLARAVLDALTGVVWADDSQVIRLVTSKRIAEPDEQPGLALVATAVAA